MGDDRSKEACSCSCVSTRAIAWLIIHGSTDSMSISSSARKPKQVGTTAMGEHTAAAPITLSERSSNGLPLLRIFVGYLWFQQLFWKLPPPFAGFYAYLPRDSHHPILPAFPPPL